MAAEHEGGHVLDRDAKLVRQEQAEAGAVQHAGHAHHLLWRQLRLLPHHPDHRLERIGDNDHEPIRAVSPDAVGQLRDHAGVLGHQVVAAHPRRAREPGGDDHDIAALDRRLVSAASHVGVEVVHRAGLHNIDGLARGDAAEEVE